MGVEFVIWATNPSKPSHIDNLIWSPIDVVVSLFDIFYGEFAV